MKSRYLFIATLFLMLACSEKTSSVEEKRQELAELKSQQTEINAKIRNLEKQLAGSSPAKADSARVKLVKAAPVSPQVFRHFISVQGTVDSDNNIMVSPKTGGVITSVRVNEGDRVSKGQVLAVIDDAVLRQSVEELKTGLELATTVYEKQKSLWDQKIGSEVQFLQAKNNKESLERRLQTLNSQLAMSSITSPINGVVDAVNIKPGEAAAPGMGAIRVVNLSQIKVQARVADSYISSVKKGDMVRIRIPDIKEEMQGKVSFVSQVVNPQSRTFDIEVSLINKDNKLKPNMLAMVDINDKTKSDALVIDANYVQKSEAGDVVFVAANEGNTQVAKMQPVKTGLSYNGTVEILEGLKSGDQLITVGYQDLTDGQSIKVN